LEKILLNASLATILPLQGRVKASYITSEKRLTAASIPQAAEESPSFKEVFFKAENEYHVDQVLIENFNNGALDFLFFIRLHSLASETGRDV
jgi:hypothetical protein